MHILPLTAKEIENRLKNLPEHVADQEYLANSEHPQSGKAVHQAILQEVGTIDQRFGLQNQSVEGTNYLTTVQASNAEIEARLNNFKPITPNNLDYAVQSVTDQDFLADSTRPQSGKAVAAAAAGAAAEAINTLGIKPITELKLTREALPASGTYIATNDILLQYAKRTVTSDGPPSVVSPEIYPNGFEPDEGFKSTTVLISKGSTIIISSILPVGTNVKKQDIEVYGSIINGQEGIIKHFYTQYKGTFTIFNQLDEVTVNEATGVTTTLSGKYISYDKDNAIFSNVLKTDLTYEPESIYPQSGTAVASAVAVKADKNKILDYITYEINNGEVTIVDCDTSIAGNHIIPDTIEGYPVVGITGKSRVGDSTYGQSEGAFYNCKDLTGLILPESVREIGYAAFIQSGLQKINIPKAVTYINSYAFYLCPISSIQFHDKITDIAAWAFYNCSSLTTVELPKSVINIAPNAFSNITDVYYEGTEEDWGKIANITDAFDYSNTTVHYNQKFATVNYVQESMNRINLATLESTATAKAELLNSSDFSYIMSNSKNMQLPGISTITFGNGVYSGGAVELQPSQVLLTEEPADWGTGLNTYYYINDKGKYVAVNQQNNQWEENKYYINKNSYVSCAMNSKEANGLEITPPTEMSSHVFGIAFSQCANPVAEDEAIGLAYKVTIKSRNETASEITAKPTLAGSLSWGTLGCKDMSLLGTYALIKPYVIENKKANPSIKTGKEYTSFIDWYNDETCDVLYTSCQQASGVHMPSSTKTMSYYVYIPFDNSFSVAPYIRSCEDSIVDDTNNVTFKLRCAGMNAGFEYIKFSNLLYITDTKDTAVNSYEYKIAVDASNYKNSTYGLFDTVVLNNDGKIVYEEPQLIADRPITSSYQTDLVMSKDTFVFSGMPKRTRVWQAVQHTGEAKWYWEYRVYGYVFGVNLNTSNGTTRAINTPFTTIYSRKNDFSKIKCYASEDAIPDNLPEGTIVFIYEE